MNFELVSLSLAGLVAKLLFAFGMFVAPVAWLRSHHADPAIALRSQRWNRVAVTALFVGALGAMWTSARQDAVRKQWAEYERIDRIYSAR
jgi:putative copper export protein